MKETENSNKQYISNLFEKYDTLMKKEIITNEENQKAKYVITM